MKNNNIGLSLDNIFTFQSLIFKLIDYLENSVIQTIPYRLHDDPRVQNLLLELTRFYNDLRIILEEESDNNPLVNRKIKLDQYLVSDICDRLDRLENENKELKKIIKKGI